MDLSQLYLMNAQCVESMIAVHALLLNGALPPQLEEAIALENVARKNIVLNNSANRCKEVVGKQWSSKSVEKRLGKVEKWRMEFDKFVAKFYANKKRRHSLGRARQAFIVRRLKEIEGKTQIQKLSNEDETIRKSAEIWVDERTGDELLVRKGTKREIVSVEDLFDVLYRLHEQIGHRSSRTVIYREVRTKYANIRRQFVEQFFRGCEWCAPKQKEE